MSEDYLKEIRKKGPNNYIEARTNNRLNYHYTQKYTFLFHRLLTLAPPFVSLACWTYLLSHV